MMNNSQGASSFFSGLSTLLGRPHPLLHNLSDTTQRTIGGPNDGQVIEYDNPRLLIYTDAFFMWAFVTGQGPRPLLPPPGEASDAEIAEAARRYFSVAGTYIRDGASLTYNRLIANIPNQMAPENQPSVRVIRTLTANRLQTQATNADGVTLVLTYTRVE